MQFKFKLHYKDVEHLFLTLKKKCAYTIIIEIGVDTIKNYGINYVSNKSSF